MIRAQIQEIISRFPPERAAIEICVFLESELDLAGNGWWDDDPKALKAMNGEEYE